MIQKSLILALRAATICILAPVGLILAAPLGTLDVPTRTQVSKTYGKLPLSFEENLGQTDSQVKFLSRGIGYTLFLTPTEAVLALGAPARRGTQEDTSPMQNGRYPFVSAEKPETTQQTVLRMKLVGANPNPDVIGLDELSGKSNYFIGNDSKKWRTNVLNYSKVAYKDVYPGIDLVYYGNQSQLEYDFIVAPGASPGGINLAFEGADKVEIDAQGDLVLSFNGGEIRLHKPRVYQELNGSTQPIHAG